MFSRVTTGRQPAANARRPNDSFCVLSFTICVFRKEVPMSAILSAPVLTLNRIFAPIRVIDVRRALSLLVTGAAEVVDAEDPPLPTYDFSSWFELSVLKEQIEFDKHAWVGLVRGRLAVPHVVRLTKFD